MTFRYELFIRVRTHLLPALRSEKVIKVWDGVLGGDSWSSNISKSWFLKDQSFGFFKALDWREGYKGV